MRSSHRLCIGQAAVRHSVSAFKQEKEMDMEVNVELMFRFTIVAFMFTSLSWNHHQDERIKDIEKSCDQRSQAEIDARNEEKAALEQLITEISTPRDEFFPPEFMIDESSLALPIPTPGFKPW